MSFDQLLPNEREALLQVTSIPQQDEAPVFNAPWEAEAFAMAVMLHEKGVFTWKEWAAELSEQISRAQSDGDPDLGNTYYHHWLTALETLVVKKDLCDASLLSQLYQDWDRAAKLTPHGEPIVLDRRSNSLSK